MGHSKEADAQQAHADRQDRSGNRGSCSDERVGKESGIQSVQKKTGRRSDKSLYEEQKKRNIELNQKIAAKDIEIAQLRQELHNLTGQ